MSTCVLYWILDECFHSFLLLVFTFVRTIRRTCFGLSLFWNSISANACDCLIFIASGENKQINKLRLIRCHLQQTGHLWSIYYERSMHCAQLSRSIFIFQWFALPIWNKCYFFMLIQLFLPISFCKIVQTHCFIFDIFFSCTWHFQFESVRLADETIKPTNINIGHLKHVFDGIAIICYHPGDTK